ncbi:MAG TPA: cyclic nucleotide-binding domain-containing protein [Candidatus Limnocylindrales bacterium]|nr:cyclic nucleotide-binding domain-containing protein [Candidatus Limnocylindrales bacterium]
MPLSREEKIDMLGSMPLFQGVDAEDLGGIADRTVEVDYAAGGVIVREGEIGTGFFVIVSGSVRVVRDGETVITLGRGEFFGELSVLDRRPRIAQVVAAEPTTCLALASWDLEAVIAEQPRVALAMLRVLAERLRDLSDAHRH